MKSLFLLGTISACLLGCSSNEGQTMESAAPTDPWEALDRFQQEGLMGPGYAAERGDWRSAQAELSSQGFESALATFEQSPLPEPYSDRQAAKEATVQQFRDVIEAAKSGSGDLQSKYESAMQALRELRTGPVAPYSEPT